MPAASSAWSTLRLSAVCVGPQISSSLAPKPVVRGLAPGGRAADLQLASFSTRMSTVGPVFTAVALGAELGAELGAD